MNSATLERLKKYATINGGFTINNNGRLIALKRGYIVSIKKYERILSINDFKALKLKDFKKLLKIAKINGYYVGAWLNNGLVYLDINKHILNEKSAITYGKKQQQKAIFNLSNYQSIIL